MMGPAPVDYQINLINLKLTLSGVGGGGRGRRGLKFKGTGGVFGIISGLARFYVSISFTCINMYVFKKKSLKWMMSKTTNWFFRKHFNILRKYFEKCLSFVRIPLQKFHKIFLHMFFTLREKFAFFSGGGVNPAPPPPS